MGISGVVFVIFMGPYVVCVLYFFGIFPEDNSGLDIPNKSHFTCPVGTHNSKTA